MQWKQRNNWRRWWLSFYLQTIIRYRRRRSPHASAIPRMQTRIYLNNKRQGTFWKPFLMVSWLFNKRVASFPSPSIKLMPRINYTTTRIKKHSWKKLRIKIWYRCESRRYSKRLPKRRKPWNKVPTKSKRLPEYSVHNISNKRMSAPWLQNRTSFKDK